MALVLLVADLKFESVLFCIDRRNSSFKKITLSFDLNFIIEKSCNQNNGIDIKVQNLLNLRWVWTGMVRIMLVFSCVNQHSTFILNKQKPLLYVFSMQRIVVSATFFQAL